MAIRRYKKISELQPVASASLSTYVAGVDNGQTVRITLETLASGVSNTINSLDTQRLNALENYTASFSSSIPNGTISGSSQLTASYDLRYILSGSVQPLHDGLISSSAQITTFGFISTSVDLAPLNTFTQSIDGRVDSLENATSSYLTSLNGTISSSAQITSFGFISESIDISSLNSFTSSQSILNTAFTSGIGARLQTSSFNDFSTSVHIEILAATNEQNLSHLVTTQSFNNYTASISTASLVDRLNSLETNTGSYLTELPNGIISSSAQIDGFETTGRGILSGSIESLLPIGLISGSSQITITESQISDLTHTDITSLNQFTQSFDTISSSFDSRIIAATNEQSFNGLISGSSQLTSSFDERYTLSGSVQNISLPDGLISSSQQITDLGFITSSQTIDTGSFATTGSNTFNTTQTIAGNLFLSSSFPLVYNNSSANNMLFGLFDGSTIHGAYYQIFGNTYPNVVQRGGAEFVYDVRNNPNADFHIASFNGSSWTPKFAVNDSGAQITGSLNVSDGITGSLDWINLINIPIGIISGNISYNDLQNIPIGIVSQSIDLTSLNEFTASFSTASLVDRLNSLESNTGSYETTGRSIISGSAQITAFGFISSSQTIDTGSFVTTSSYNADSASFDSRITSLTVAGTPAGTISGSAQITAFGFVSGSYETTGRGILSGSISYNNLTNIPTGLISSSAQLNEFETTGRNIISSSAQISDLGFVTSGGNVTFNSVTANQYIVSSSVYYVTQSYSSGSTIFGNTADDTHQFTGSVLISGSLTANLTNGHMWVGNSLNLSYQFPTASLLSTASFNSFTSSQFNTLSASVASVQTNLNQVTASLGVTSTPFTYTGVVNPSNYVLVSYATASYNGGSMDIIVTRASDSTAVSANCLLASYGANGSISVKGSTNSGAGAPNPSFDLALSGSHMNIRISVSAGTYTIKGVARLF